jgi:hypothetical protein
MVDGPEDASASSSSRAAFRRASTPIPVSLSPFTACLAVLVGFGWQSAYVGASESSSSDVPGDACVIGPRFNLEQVPPG